MSNHQGTVLQRLQLWFWGKFFILLIVLGSSPRRRRMSHNHGILGRGRIRIVDDPKIPPTKFFEPGRVFPCRLRHANVAYLDDAMKVARSATLKFADSDFASPFDLQMNSGQFAFFWNARTFLQFAFWRDERQGIEYEKYYRTYPEGRVAAASAFRIDPASYVQVYFHSQTPFAWIADDGKPRLVKFRLIPGDRGPQTAQPPLEWIERAEREPEMAAILSNQRTVPGETRGPNYLKAEWRERVKAGEAKYLLQVQLHEVAASDSPEIRNPHVYWDETSHPFIDLATVEIDEVLPYEEACRIGFEITNHPPSIGILEASSIDDYNSLNYMRKQSIWAIRTRRAFTRWFGPPKPVGDDDPHNVNPPGM